MLASRKVLAMRELETKIARCVRLLACRSTAKSSPPCTR
jgi:hypothetical protein